MIKDGTQASTSVAQSRRLSLDDDDSYGGLIEVPVMKKISIATTKLISYFDQYAQYPAWYSKLVAFIRVFQFLAPAMLMSSEIIWDPKDPSGIAISFLSFFAHIIPAPYILACHMYVLTIFNILFIILVVVYISCSFYYSKYTKIYHPLAKVLSGVIPLIYVSYAIIAQSCSQYGTAENKNTSGVNPAPMVGLIFCLVCFICYIVCLDSTFSNSLIFRGLPLQAIEQRMPNHIFYATLIMTIVSGAVYNRGEMQNMIACAVNIIVYATSIATLFLYSEIINRTIMTAILTSEIAGIFISISNIAILSIGRKADSMYLFVIVGETAIAFMIASFILKKKWAHDLVFLDTFHETNELPSDNPNTIVKVITTGFNNAHPACIDYSICEAAATQFPNNFIIYAIYARLVAIYPEMNDKLFVIRKVIDRMTDVSSNKKKALIQQIGLVTKSRETNLDPSVKSMINEFNKEQSKAKTRVRNVWDLILQGNTNEIKRSCYHAKIACDNAEHKIIEIMQVYPNNRFVARAYAHFHKEILADKAVHRQWKENIALLQRGIRVVPDCAHTLGTKTFPELPSSVGESKRGSSYDVNTSEIDNQSDDFTGDEDEDEEKFDLLNAMITDHQLPSTTCTIWTTILLYIFVIFVPAIAIYIYFTNNLTTEMDPLTYIRDTAIAMEVNAMMTSYTIRAVLEEVTDPSTGQTYYDNKMGYEHFDMESCGGNNNLRDITKYLTKTVTSKVKAVEHFSNYHKGNAKADHARELLFSDSIQYTFFTSKTSAEKTKTSVETAIVRTSSQVASLFEEKTFTQDTILSTSFKTIVSNYVDVTVAIGDAINGVVEALKEISSSLEKRYNIIFIATALSIIIIYSVAMYFEIRSMKRNNIILYKSFGYLPKTVISNISSKFNILKKTCSEDGTQSIGEIEMNKQEENIIKVFGTMSDSMSNNTDIIGLSAAVITIVATIVCIAFICYGFTNVHASLIQSVPHLPYLYGTTMLMNTLSTLFFKGQLITEFPDEVTAFDDGDVDQMILSFVKMFMEYYQNAIFGDSVSMPLDSSAGIMSAKKQLQCENRYDGGIDFVGIIKCMDISSHLYLLTSWANQITCRYVENGNQLNMRDEVVDHFWLLGPVILSDSLMYSLSSNILDQLNSTIDSTLSPVTVWFVILLIVALISTFVVVSQALNNQKMAVFVLKMYLHCPLTTIIENPKIMNVIDGCYEYHDEDSTSRDSMFFYNVVNKLTDYVLVVKYVDQTIVMTNDSFDSLFGITDKETTFYGKNVMEVFFNKEHFTGDLSEIFKEQTEVKYTNGEKTISLSFSCVIINGNAIIFGRDISLSVQHHQLIADERKKSDQLLSSILPANLVPRVQAGEKDISFAIQSVTVTFMDVVEFTPWCGSNTAQHVMSTLNTMFKEFDALVSTHKTMTRVKCIGDCYMAAGGIFDEVNNPSQHAKEVVEFGCEAIKKILEIDEMLNEKLRIRVGVNTGGPIVAGVLGTEKPTFEILGPPINIAQQMEHFGVPMQVHISRHVYELIYGSNFNIKERGEIDVKNGKMFTYLVQP